MSKGMRIGGKHKWSYHTERWNEVKVAPRKWKFTFSQTKRRRGYAVHGRQFATTRGNSHANWGQGMPKGARLHWKGEFDQYAVKTSPNTYRLTMKGTKYQAGYKMPKDRKWRKPPKSVTIARGAKKELKEHPWAGYKRARKIAIDHIRKGGTY